MRRPPQIERLSGAALRLLHAPSQLTGQDAQLLTRAIKRHLARGFPQTDHEEIAQETLVRLSSGDVAVPARLTNPVGFVLRVAERRAIDEWRRTSRHLSPLSVDLLEESRLTESDDEIARHLDQVANAQVLKTALAEAASKRDTTAIRVVGYMLEELERDGSLPSNRSVASALGLSHTGVAKALERFRSYLPQTAGEDFG